MEQQSNNQFSNQPVLQLPKPKTVKPFLVVILLVLVLALVGVLLWQKDNANQIVDSLQQQVSALQNQVFQKNNQPGETINCIKGGEELMADSLPQEDSCCSGLVKISTSIPTENLAVDPTGCTDSIGKKVCTACGNGVCGTGENKCNCPADCKSATTSDKIFGQFYRNEVYGFEIKYPEQWSLIDRLPKVERETVSGESLEFFNSPFPLTVARFVFTANLLPMGAEFCDVMYKINSNGLNIIAAIKGEDRCSPGYQSSVNYVIERCGGGKRYACFNISKMNNGNGYFGYLQTDRVGDYAFSDSEADGLLQKILLSFKTF